MRNIFTSSVSINIMFSREFSSHLLQLISILNSDTLNQQKDTVQLTSKIWKRRGGYLLGTYFVKSSCSLLNRLHNFQSCRFRFFHLREERKKKKFITIDKNNLLNSTQKNKVIFFIYTLVINMVNVFHIGSGSRDWPILSYFRQN